MRAIALLAPGKIALIEQPEPACGPTDVVISMRAVGLCGSDLSVYSGATPVPHHPWVIGHEGGGEILAVGDEVEHRKPGEIVVIEPNICCFKCGPCKAGQTSSCTNRRALGMTEPGIAAERVAAPAEFCWPLSDNASSTTLAGFEPHVVAQAAVRRAGVQPGDRCLVIGTGSQGLMLCLQLLSIGVHPFVVEPHAGRRQLALELGARPDQPDGGGYRFVFESSGARSAFRGALDATAVGGQLVLIGQNHKTVEITTRELVQRQITIRGSLIYDHPQDFANAAHGSQAQAPQLAAVMQKRYAPFEADLACRESHDVPGKSWIDLTSGWTQ